MGWVVVGGLVEVSVMLPLYAAALEGKTACRVEKGYSTGLHRIDWRAKYAFILDARRSCEASPLWIIAQSDWNKIWGPGAPLILRGAT